LNEFVPSVIFAERSFEEKQTSISVFQNFAFENSMREFEEICSMKNKVLKLYRCLCVLKYSDVNFFYVLP
jgi:hypothetical protein